MSKIYVISTPIGNLSDITLRALEVLKSVDVIACEDTRVTLKLLNHFEIKKPLISYHQHSGTYKIDKILEEVSAGKNVGVVTDAGTPAISDPGFELIRGAREGKIEVEVIPGASALTAALAVSGIDAREFIFLGFLPHKKGRSTKLKALSTEQRTVVLYESPYRIKKLLNELAEIGISRNIFVARELTKKFEETYFGKVEELVNKVKEKGELVVIIEGNSKKVKEDV